MTSPARYLALLHLFGAVSSGAEDPTGYRLDFAWAMVGSSTWHDSLALADPDGDSRPELLGTFAGYWYQLQLDDLLQHEYASIPGDDSLVRIVPASASAGTDLLLVWPDRVEVLNGATRKLSRTISTQVDPLVSAAVADLDADGDLEIVLCGATALETRNYSNGALIKKTAARGGINVSVGQIDADPQLEIAVLGGPSGSAVLDSTSHAADWTLPVAIYDDLRLADLDADGKDEVLWAGGGVFAWNPRTNLAHFSRPGFSPELVEVADLDGNGSAEVIGGGNNLVIVLSGGSGATLWSLDVPELEHTCCSGLAVGNLDADPALEIALKGPGGSGTSGPLVVVDAASHSLQYADRRFGPEFVALASGDLDADGSTELVLGSSASGFVDPGRFLILDHTAQRVEFESDFWSGPYSGRLWSAAVAQLDGDAALEICVTGDDGTLTGTVVRCLDGATFVEEWQREIPADVIGGHLIAADLDGNGGREILVSTFYGSPRSVFALDGETGAIVWQSDDFPSNPWEPGPIRVGDVVGDARLEIVLLFPRWGIAILDAESGATLYGPFLFYAGVAELAQIDLDAQLEILVEADCATVKPMNPVSGALGATQVAAPACLEAMRIHDLNRDGTADFVFAYPNRVRVVDGQSKTLAWESPTLTPELAYGDALLTGDFDGDTVPEIAFGSEYGLFVVESPLIEIFSSGFESGTTGWTVSV